MGLLHNQSGRIKWNVIRAIDEKFGEEVEQGKQIEEQEIDTFVHKAVSYFEHVREELKCLEDDLAELDTSSYGVYYGHEGANAYFWSVLKEHMTYDAVRKDVLRILGAVRIENEPS